jgi:ABC-type uncharacterized transport system involved in gliding motility auxiliary subunit
MDARTGRLRGTVLLLLTAAVTVAALLVAGRFAFRLDLSADRSQSLSPVAHNLYREVPEHLHITYYISPTLSAKHPGPRAIEDLLREFEASSRGRIDLSVEDPSKRSGAVEALGVQGRQMQIVEQNEQRVAVVYSGIVLQYLDKSEVIPFVLDGATLEYDLVKAVRRAVGTAAQKVSVLVGDADKSMANDYKTVGEELRKSGWEVSEVNRGDAIPPETRVLLVLGNSDIDDYAAYRVEEYLARGGAAFLAVKGVGVEARQDLTAAALKEDGLLRALSAWGIEVGRSLVLDASSLTVPFQQAGQFGSSVIRYVQYPHWIITRPEFASKSNPVTSKLAGLDLYWPSPLTLKDRSGVKGEALVKSTPKAWLQTANFAIRPEESANFQAEAGKTGGQYTLAVTLAGPLPGLWASGAPPLRAGAAALSPQQNPPAPSKIIVIGSSDFATDLMAMTNSLFNAAFVAAATDWLATGDELAAIKTRGQKDPRLSKIQDPAVKNSYVIVSYAINLVLVPGILLAVALVRRRTRRLLSRMEAVAFAKQDGASRASGTEAGK